ncbi:SPOSA6832_03356, partial [Sporobolomyces salmonicolor]
MVLLGAVNQTQPPSRATELPFPLAMSVVLSPPPLLSLRTGRTLICELRSGGKSSIRKVVFEGMAPNDTLFIEKTAKSSSDDLNSFLSMRMWDLPGGQLDPEQLNLSFEDTDAVIFVLDAQSTLHDMIRKLGVTMHKAYTANPNIQFEIFLHKVDGMSEDYRLDTLQNLRDRLTEELFDMSPEIESNMNVFYHLTSVFDTSIYEALSKVIQKLIPEQAMLERLLDLLCQVCPIPSFLPLTRGITIDPSFAGTISNARWTRPSSSKQHPRSTSRPILHPSTTRRMSSAQTTSTSWATSPSSTSAFLAFLPASRSLSIYRACVVVLNSIRLSARPSTAFPDHPSTSATSSPVAPASPARKEPSAPATLSPSIAGPTNSLARRRSAAAGEGKKRRLPHSRVKLGTGATIAQWAINEYALPSSPPPPPVPLLGSPS